MKAHLEIMWERKNMNSKNIVMIIASLFILASCNSGGTSGNGNGKTEPGQENEKPGTAEDRVQEKFTIASKVMPFKQTEISCDLSETHKITVIIPEENGEMTVAEFLDLAMKSAWNDLAKSGGDEAKKYYNCLVVELNKHIKAEI